MELILIRHGLTPGNRERRFLGVTDQPLAPEGEEQARRAARVLPGVEHIYVSPLVRCRRTAELVWPGVGQTVIDQLRETDFGPFEGKNHRELEGDPLYQQWLAAGDFIPGSGGETLEQAAGRAARALRLLLADAGEHGYERAGVVSHGGTLMGILSQFGYPARDYYGWSCPNCGGFRAQVHTDPTVLEIVEDLGGEGI